MERDCFHLIITIQSSIKITENNDNLSKISSKWTLVSQFMVIVKDVCFLGNTHLITL